MGKTKIYIVERCVNLTDGVGPKAPVRVYFNKQKAVDWVLTQPGIMGSKITLNNCREFDNGDLSWGEYSIIGMEIEDAQD